MSKSPSLRAPRFRRQRAWLAVVTAAACTPLESADDRFEPIGPAGSAGALVAGAGGSASGDAASAGTGNVASSETGGAGGPGSADAGNGGGTRAAGSSGTSSTSAAGEGGDGGAAGSSGAEPCPPVEERRLIALGPGEVSIDQDTTWTCDSVHELAGTLLVAPGATLSLEAGSLVRVAKGGLILVQRRGRLVANGNSAAPIVFTSAEAEGARGPGDWRGVVLIGDGPSHAVNVPVYNTLGDGRADFGGGPQGDANGSCGALRFVRIEFAGGSLDEAANPGAGLTLAGCGAGTELDYLQVHRATDGLGLVGGTANLRHVIVSANARGDSIEWTGGYRGALQFVIAQSLGAATALLGSNSDSDPLAEPVSGPTIYNASLVGSAPLVTGAHFGLALQFGSGATLKNSLIMGFADAAFDLRLPGDMLENAVGPSRAIDVSHVLLSDNARSFTATAEVLSGMASMRSGDPGLALATDRGMPLFQPTGSEVLIEPAPTPPPFDTTAAFRGAVAPSGQDWTLGWTAFPGD
jgi:hypothetical protein